MKGQPNRLDTASAHLMGTQIDRNAPLRFTLDGRTISGFAGDTVLSAALASGIDTAGLHDGSPLALDSRFAPPVAPASDPGRTLPMHRTPARNGQEFVTVGRRNANGVLGLLSRQGRSLGHRFEKHAPATAPWRDAEPGLAMEADVVVVGGGVAGLSAAVTAGQSGASVILIERRQNLGGNARLFGSIEEEEPPDSIVARLTKALTHLANVTVLTRTEAIRAGSGILRAHRVETGENGLSAHILTIATRRIVLAAGMIERLPIFSGNRLPGVVSLLEAFDRADRFGIWPGRNIAFNTAASPAYRLAMQAIDAGLSVAKMSDTRLRAQSRFIEFSKAYGMPLSSGLVPQSVEPYRHGGLEIRLRLEMENYARPEPSVIADQFVVCGGWQPELSLWIGAGGQTRWQSGGLIASGASPGMALAGAAAGFRSLTGCAQSGSAAVASLFGWTAVPVFDVEIDPIYETPDGGPSLQPTAPGDVVPAYLDHGVTLAARPGIVRQSRLAFLRRPRPALGLSEAAHPLSLGDLAGFVGLGLIPEHEAGVVAQERCVDAMLLPQAPVPSREPIEGEGYPAYLRGRFGPDQAAWHIVADEPRHFEAGNLLYPNTDAANPLAATGVVIGPAPGGQARAVAVVTSGEAGKRLVLRDLGRHVSVKLAEKL